MARFVRAAVSSLLLLSVASPAFAQTRLYPVDGRALSVLDGDTFQQLAKLDLIAFGNPSGIAIASNGSRAYVGLGGSQTFKLPADSFAAGSQPKVAVVDLLNVSVLHTVDVGGTPLDLVASPAGDRVYVAVTGASGSVTIVVIRTSDDAVVGTVPLTPPAAFGAFAVSPDGAKLYFGDKVNGSNGIVEIDTGTFAVSPFSPTSATCLTAATVSPDSRRLYVGGACPPGGGSINTYDIATRQQIVSVETAARGVAITPDGSKLFATGGLDFNGAHAPTLILDARTLAELGRVTPSGRFVAVGPSGVHAYTYGFWGNVSCCYPITSVNVVTGGLERQTSGGFPAMGFAVAPAPSPAPMTLDKMSLIFAAVSTGAAFTSQTPAQTVRLRQSDTGAVAWTATSTAPWLVVSPTSGSGPATLSISTQFAPGLTDSQTGSVIVALTGRSDTVGPVSVRLTTVSGSAPASPPFGVFDTPAGDATVLAGSVAVTGWALDNIGVKRVELWRDLQPGETTPPFSSTPTDPRNGKVFIASPTFVDGARPDIEALYPSTPVNYRGGWGYLMLTWGLWNQGNGTYKLYAFAFDQEDNVATIGTKTIIVNNNLAFRPFGSIDTPAVGGEASGPNFGWALAPNVNDGSRPGVGATTCKIQPSGVKVSIDSGPLQPVVYGDVRTDVAAAFPGFTNSAAAGGHYLFDWSTLTNGVHTIGWVVTDDCGRADGVGSRFFNVTNGVSALTASSDAQFRLKAETTQIDPVASAFRRNDDVLVSRGYGELSEIVTPDETGDRSIEVKQGERIELRLPRGFDSAYQLGAGGQRRALPTGATWDEASGVFYWQPAPAFLGRYRLVFSNGSERISIRVVVRP